MADQWILLQEGLESCHTVSIGCVVIETHCSCCQSKLSKASLLQRCNTKWNKISIQAVIFTFKIKEYSFKSKFTTLHYIFSFSPFIFIMDNSSIGYDLSTMIAGKHMLQYYMGIKFDKEENGPTVQLSRESIHQQFPLKHFHGLHPDHALISGLFYSCQNTAWLEIRARRRPSAHHHHPSSFCSFPRASNVCQ